LPPEGGLPSLDDVTHQVPRSIMSTFFPFWASLLAAIVAPNPVPTTMASYFSGMQDSPLPICGLFTTKCHPARNRFRPPSELSESCLQRRAGDAATGFPKKRRAE